MNNLLKKVKRKLIFINKPAGKPKTPLTPKAAGNTDIFLEGQNLLDQFRCLGSDLFRDYDRDTRVLVKVNLNSALAYPASVSMDMLETLVTSLSEIGIRNIVVADCSGITHLPTSEVIKIKGMKSLKIPGLKIKSFDYGKWYKVPIAGEYFSYIILPEAAFLADRIINLSNLKAHNLAGFSAATKNLVGFMHPKQRFELHKDHLIERTTEIPLAIMPDINIIDARKIFIEGGPDRGTVLNADTIIINSSLYYADRLAYELLVGKKSENDIHDLPKNYMDNPFFRHYDRINGSSI
ncbi:MAG: DUF362 domain-containing protein [Clostridia bacterium]|nr:DUF362 domain-containing protein [Clostridia bacterium]MBN2882180.1 DUF362 domain-containing protein [Clostridia bacterium]